MIRYADIGDLDRISKLDEHIEKKELENSINQNRVLVMYENDRFIGWLRYNLFWDQIPFMNMLYLLEDARQKGYGSKLVALWEKEMHKNGYKIVLTSTQSNEEAQYFYRKIGYSDCGCFMLPDEPLELVLLKKL